MKYILSTTTTAILKRTIIARFHPPTSRFCFFSTQSLLYRNDPKAIHDDYSYCINLVKERDGEGYRTFLCIFFQIVCICCVVRACVCMCGAAIFCFDSYMDERMLSMCFGFVVVMRMATI